MKIVKNKVLTNHLIINFRTLFFTFLLFLAFYLPLEDFFLKFLPVSDKAYIFVRQLSDFLLVIIYVFFFFSLLVKNKLRIPSKILTLALFIFLIYVILLVFLRNEIDLTAISKIKALLRYVFLIFLIYYFRPDEKFVLRFIRLVIILTFIEAIIGYTEIFGGNIISSIFAPRLINNPELGLVFTSALAIQNNTGEIFGTMPYTINYSLFLVVGLTLWLFWAKYIYGIRNVMILILSVIFLVVPIYFSGSRTSFFAALLVILLFVRFKYGNKIFVSLLILYLLIFSIIFPFLPKFGNNQNFWAFLSPHFIEILKHQRLGLLQGFFNNLFNPNLITGVGSDRSVVWNFVVNKWNLPFYMGQIVEDVYWLALIIYYGYVGLFIFIIFLISIYIKLNKVSKISHPLKRYMVNTAKTLLILTIPLNFFNQAFEVRTFSFYLWVICGLAISYYPYYKGKLNVENSTNK